MKLFSAGPLLVGFVTALVGFTSSFAVVLAGLNAVGASPAQATLGLITLNVTQGLATIALSIKHRIPVLTAWSTPGAAILIASAGVAASWSAAIGAFIACGLLIILTAAWPWLGALISRIPAPLAQAMLAGVLLTICIEPIIALADTPLFIAPVIVLWLACMRWAPRWATPLAFALALLIITGTVLHAGTGFTVTPPRLTATWPTLDGATLVGIAIPLYIVTMASQNVPGMAIMRSYGYQVPWTKALLTTGIGTVLGAPTGGHTINLAAITAALPASSESHPDPNERWKTAVWAGIGYLLLAIATPLLTAAAEVAPPGMFETVAGLALIGTLVASLAAAFAEPGQRIATGVTFITAASPIVLFGIGSAFWGLLLGLISWALFRGRWV